MSERQREELFSKIGYMENRDLRGLSENEKSILDSTGYWLEALATGCVQPTSLKGKRFVDVSQWRKKPVTKYEKAWVKLQALQVAIPFFERLLASDFSCIRELGSARPEVVYDCLVELLRQHREEATDSDVRLLMIRAEIKVSDAQHERQSVDGGPITNFGGLHDYGL